MRILHPSLLNLIVHILYFPPWTESRRTPSPYERNKNQPFVGYIRGFRQLIRECRKGKLICKYIDRKGKEDDQLTPSLTIMILAVDPGTSKIHLAVLFFNDMAKKENNGPQYHGAALVQTDKDQSVQLSCNKHNKEKRYQWCDCTDFKLVEADFINSIEYKKTKYRYSDMDDNSLIGFDTIGKEIVTKPPVPQLKDLDSDLDSAPMSSIVMTGMILLVVMGIVVMILKIYQKNQQLTKSRSGSRSSTSTVSKFSTLG